MTERQIEIARRALGLTRQPKSYRNHFVTGPDTTDWADLMAMVDGGWARKESGSGHLDVFVITDAGKALAVREGESL